MLQRSPTAPSDSLDQWPSIHEAYAFVMPSYQWLVARFEAADTRLTALLTFVAPLTLGVPVLARMVRPELSFTSPLFLVALVAFVLAAAVGVTARVSGHLVLPNPGFLYEHTLHESPLEFQKNALYFAGQHFTANAHAIDLKSRCAAVVLVAFLVEILAFIAWVAW